jgi:3-oxoacyl-[acyl-carrier protein] reductase
LFFFGAKGSKGRVGTGDEIAQAILLLVGNAYMTGQTIGVNGGVLFS